MAMSEDALRELLPALAFPLFVPAISMAVFIPVAAVIVYLASGARKVEQLAARLRRLCESTGRPEIRSLRPRRLSLDIRSLERTLLALERDQGTLSRRLPSYRRKGLMGDLEQRISRLEERGLG